MKKERAGLRVKLLGGFETRLATGATVTLPTRKAQALLAYLAARPGQGHARDKLAALLWADRGDAQAHDSLRHTLVELRKVLPERPASLITEGRAVALAAAVVDVDVVRFETLAKTETTEDLAQAAEIYQGEFLEGFVLREAAFEEWLGAERERLRELALGTLRRLLEHQARAVASEAAIRTALRLVALDATQEVAHRALMRLYVQQGRRAAALRQYQTCVGVLQRELGTEPDVETRQLYREIIQRRDEPGGARRGPAKSSAGPSTPARAAVVRAGPSAAETPLIGRSTELATLGNAFDEARWGRGRVVAIVGEAGVGKSRLVSELARKAVEHDARVLIGRCYESEQILPFGPWVDALRAGLVVPEDPALLALEPAWRAELARLFPEITAVGVAAPTDDARRLFESLTRLCGALSVNHPVLLVLEDVHWADEMSMRLLAFLGRRIAADRLLLAITAREEELADADALRRTLGELRGEAHFADLVLSPLSRADTSTLVRSLGIAGSDSRAMARLEEQAWAVSVGNPFVVVETVRALREGLMLQEPANLPLPQRVRDVIAGRVERLSEPGRHLLSVAAVLGREFDFALLQRAAGFGDREAAEALEELVRRRVLQSVGEHFDFTHARIREVMSQQLLSPRRKLVHRDVAAAIEELHAINLEPYYAALAEHYRKGEVWDRAARFLYLAGERSLAYSAYAEAARLFDSALQALKNHGAGRDRVLEFDIVLELWTALFESGLYSSRSASEGEARLVELSERGEALAATLDDDARVARLRLRQAQAFWVTWHRPDASEATIQHARQVVRLARPDDVRTRGYAMFLSAVAHRNRGRFADALKEFDAGIGLSSVAAGEPDGQALLVLPVQVSLYSWRAELLAVLGRFEAAMESGREAVRLADAAGHGASRATARAFLGYVLISKGNLESALGFLESGLAEGESLGLTHAIVRNAYPLAYVLFLLRRRDEGLRALARASDARGSRTSPEGTRFGFLSGSSHLRAGQHAAADDALTQGLSLAATRNDQGQIPPLLRVRADVLATREADPAEELRLRHEGLRLATELGLRPEAAHGHFGLSRFHRRAGDESRAAASLTTALDLYRELEMGWWERVALGAGAGGTEDG